MRAGLNGHAKAGPSPALRRAEAARNNLRATMYEEMAGQAQMLCSAGYENARPSRLRPGARLSRGGSADSFRDGTTRDSLRRQCQQLDRNNVLARGLVQRLIDMVIGDGFVLQARTQDPKWNALAEQLFNEWAESEIDIRGKHSIDNCAAENVRAACFDGDLMYIKTEDGQLQAIEGERIRNPGGGLDRPTALGTMMVGGVEMDLAGRALRYHVSNWSGLSGNSFPEMKTQAVPAEAVLFLVNPLRDVTGATRGEPQLQAALKRFEDLEDLDLSVRVAARIHAILSTFITLENPQADALMTPGTFESQANADGDDQETKIDELEPGTIRRLRPNEKIQNVASTQPGPDYTGFVLMQVLQICADLGLPLPLAMLDARQVNLSSIRSVLQFAWRHFERWQSWQTRKFYRPVYAWRTAMFIREGRLPFREDWFNHDWMARTPPVMDPKVEVEAARARVDAGFAAPSRVIREVWGLDAASEWEQSEKDADEMARRGVERLAAPGAGGGGPGGGPSDPADKPERPSYDDDETDGQAGGAS